MLKLRQHHLHRSAPFASLLALGAMMVPRCEHKVGKAWAWEKHYENNMCSDTATSKMQEQHCPNLEK